MKTFMSKIQYLILDHYKKLDDQQKRQGYELIDEDEYNLDDSNSSDMDSLSLGSAKDESNIASAVERSKKNDNKGDVETGRAQSLGLISQNVSLKEDKANQEESNYDNSKDDLDNKLVIKENRF